MTTGRCELFSLRLLPAVGLLCAITSASVARAEVRREFDCLVEARQEVDVRSPVEGIIESLLVRRGSSVERGQVIATLAAGPERAALELARWRAGMRGDLNAAETRATLAHRKWMRSEDLVKQKFVPEATRDEAQVEYELATAQLQAARESQRLAELDVKRAEEVLGQRTIRSPVSGVVVDVGLQPGELAASNQNQPILQLMEVDPLNVELVLPVSAFGTLKVGQQAKVSLEAPIGGVYMASVEVVDRTLDAASGTFRVRLRLPNPGGRLPAGAKCRARF